MHSSAAPHFQLGSGFWAPIPEPIHHDLLHRYATRARELLARHQARIPDDGRLHLIVQAAMEARALYYAATLAEPTTEDLDEFFDHFVICCTSGISGFGEERDDN
jgi:hypothetical protein